MANKLMYIPNDNIQNQCLKRLDSQLNEPTNQNSILVSNISIISKAATLLEAFRGDGDAIRPLQLFILVLRNKSKTIIWGGKFCSWESRKGQPPLVYNLSFK